MLQALVELFIAFVLANLLIVAGRFLYKELRYAVAVYSVLRFIKNISIVAEIDVYPAELTVFKKELYAFFRQYGVENFNIHTSKGNWVGIGDWCIFDE